MKRLSFVPEMFIWLAFFVVAGFCYAFSFFDYIKAEAHMSVTDIVVPALVWVLLAVICTFLLKRVRDAKWFVDFSKAEKVFLECSVLTLLLIGGWVFRFVDYFHGVWPLELDNTYFQYAQVSQAAEAYLNPHPASRLYVAILHVICMLFGNIYEVGTLVQFVLLIAAIFVWYATIRKTFGAIVALFFVGSAMLLPGSIQMSMQCNPTMMLLFIYGCIAYFMVQYAHSKIPVAGALVCEFLLAILLATAIILDFSGVLLIVVYGIAIRRHTIGRPVRGFVSFIVACLGAITAVILFTVLQANVYGMSYEKALFFQAYSKMIWKVPNLNDVRAFAFSLGTHPVFFIAIVAISIYWLLMKKQAFTWIMLSVLYLFALQLMGLDSYLQHDFAIHMFICTLVGVSLQQYLVMPINEAVVEKIEPVVMVVNFEEEPAVTIPERPQIFIPKSMEIPKRISKPKIDFAVEVDQEKMHYDYPVKDTDDFDV